MTGTVRPTLDRSLAHLVPAPGPHGGDGARVAAALGLEPADILELSATLNPLAPDPTAVVSRHLDAIGRYPDPSQAAADLAATMGVDPDLLVLTNGGAEAISVTAAEMGGRVDGPDFSLYPRDGGATAPLWRSNPHSPSGCLAGRGESAEVWDEAFWPLTTGTWTRGDHLGGAVVLGSLTKLLACPGLRVGYALCPDADLARRLQARQPAWSVNGLVAEGLGELLDTVDLAGWSTGLRDLRSALVEVLGDVGLDALPGDAPWVLVDDAGDLRIELALHGIVVRDCASFGSPGTVRIAVPDHDGRARLAEALGRVR